MRRLDAEFSLQSFGHADLNAALHAAAFVVVSKAVEKMHDGADVVLPVEPPYLVDDHALSFLQLAEFFAVKIGVEIQVFVTVENEISESSIFR